MQLSWWRRAGPCFVCNPNGDGCCQTPCCSWRCRTTAAGSHYTGVHITQRRHMHFEITIMALRGACTHHRMRDEYFCLVAIVVLLVQFLSRHRLEADLPHGSESLQDVWKPLCTKVSVIVLCWAAPLCFCL